MTNNEKLNGLAAMTDIPEMFAGTWEMMQEMPDVANTAYLAVFASIDSAILAAAGIAGEDSARAAGLVALYATDLASIAVTGRPSDLGHDAESLKEAVSGILGAAAPNVDFSRDLRFIRKYVEMSMHPILDAALAIISAQISSMGAAPLEGLRLTLLMETVALAGQRCMSAFTANLGAQAQVFKGLGYYVPDPADAGEFTG